MVTDGLSFKSIFPIIFFFGIKNLIASVFAYQFGYQTVLCYDHISCLGGMNDLNSMCS